MMSTTWHGDEVEKKLVNPAIVRELTRLVIMGETKSKLIITELGRVKSNLMRGSTTHEVDPVNLKARYGSPIKPKPPAQYSYPVYQELGTETIKPGYFYRGALDWLKTQER